jgi:hypothetical protein
MQSLSMKCNLQRCNVDGTLEMTLDKCVLVHASPCYYLCIKTYDEERPEDAWKKFDHYVAGKKPASA